MRYLYVHTLLLKDVRSEKVSDALRELADYLDSVDHPKNAEHVQLDTRIMQCEFNRVWKEFLGLPPNKRLVGSIGVGDTEKEK